MDSLSANQAFLDYKNKRVVPNEMGVIFQGSLFDPSSCIMFINEAVKLLGEGGEPLWLVLLSLSHNPRTG